MTKKIFNKKQKFLHRDISWLSFNERVLEEAMDLNNPFLERVKFLAIFVNNLDEFFMVRMAGIKNLITSEIQREDAFGYYPQELFDVLMQRVDELIDKLYAYYSTKVIKDFGKYEIHLKNVIELKKDEKKFIKDYFTSVLYPILTPMAVDPGHPFPILPSKTLAFAVHINRKGEKYLAIIPLPNNIPRLVRLPSLKNENKFILVDEIIRTHLKIFFKGYRIEHYALFRIIRDSELSIDEELTPDLLKAIENEVKKRTRANAVYMEIEKNCSIELLEILGEGLKFPLREIKHINSHLDLTYLFQLVHQVNKPELCFPGYIPPKLEYENIFEKMNEEDLLIHLPFQSFQPTVDLIEAAAKDEDVLAIKMTLYRTNRNSTIIQALKEAAQNKKQITVLVEIKARFDEENNIKWVRELEEAGCHVIYGIPGLKVHSKMTLIVRKKEGVIHRYVHLSTGNYNENTAKIYSDIGYFTSNEDFAKDISDVFNVVTGYSMPSPWKRIISSPNDLRDYFFALIDREMKFQKKHKNGFIKAKMNSLEDPAIIDKLYEASCAGVKIRLLIRGICCLIPGIKGLSENIKVKSIVGRFLEHSRVYIFNNNSSSRVFLSSADWMRRNLDRRVEVLFEIYNQTSKEHLKEVLDTYWKDNVKARVLHPDRTYHKTKSNDEKFNVQEYYINYYRS